MITPPPWIPVCPVEYLNLTKHLAARERGIFAHLFLLLQTYGGRVADNSRWLAQQTACSTYRWNRTRLDLLARGLLQLHDGRLSNPIVTRELAYYETRVLAKRRAGERGRAVRYAKKPQVFHHKSRISTT